MELEMKAFIIGYISGLTLYPWFLHKKWETWESLRCVIKSLIEQGELSGTEKELGFLHYRHSSNSGFITSIFANESMERLRKKYNNYVILSILSGSVAIWLTLLAVFIKSFIL